MNPGAAEEAGKAANTFMQSLKDQPLSLALVVMNLALLGLFFYIAHVATENRSNEFSKMIEAQKEVNLLLSKCVVPGG